MKRFFDVRWDDPHLYHLTINTGKWDIEAAAQIIVNSVEQLGLTKPKPDTE
jgi:cytidylate kinase